MILCVYPQQSPVYSSVLTMALCAYKGKPCRLCLALLTCIPPGAVILVHWVLLLASVTSRENANK